MFRLRIFKLEHMTFLMIVGAIVILIPVLCVSWPDSGKMSLMKSSSQKGCYMYIFIYICHVHIGSSVVAASWQTRSASVLYSFDETGQGQGQATMFRGVFMFHLLGVPSAHVPQTLQPCCDLSELHRAD